MRVTPVFYKIAASFAVVTVGSVLVYRMMSLELSTTRHDPEMVASQAPADGTGAGGKTKARQTEVAGGKQFPDAKPIQQRLALGEARPEEPRRAPEPAVKMIQERLEPGTADTEYAALAKGKKEEASQPSLHNGLEQRIEDALKGATGGANKAPSPVQTASADEAQPVHTIPTGPDGIFASPAKPATYAQDRLAEQPLAGDDAPVPEVAANRDQFEAAADNAVKQVAAEPVSTFSIDVDTASYAFARRALNGGHLPQKDAVRVEEMINYFPYSYPRPETADVPFRPTVTVVPAPWNPQNRLLHIGIKGYELRGLERPRANLVFLIDVSGSMSPADRLPLVKNAFRMLVDELKPDDTIGIVTYASGTGVALQPTKIAEKAKILAAIDHLGAGGSTAGAQGLQDAYRLAEANFDKAAVNRVILATDGDFNVGITDKSELTRFIEDKRQTGIFLSILGVGQDNYNDALMQKLAQNGNGTAAYVDTLSEARKVLVDEASSTLFPIAKDVKIQIEFNPAMVSEYRLIGYETRALKREDFNNDKVDAGDIGSGHTVTAIYELTPAGAPKFVDDLRYGKAAEKPAAPADGGDGELAFLKLRYKLPKEDVSKLITVPVTKALEKPVEAAPEDVRFSVAVAAFGQLLRGLPYMKGYSFDDVIALAKSARGPDEFGYRTEFLNLLRLAKSAKP